MTPRYRDVYRSHRLLFLLPIVIAGSIALWSSVAAPKLYRSGSTLWSDTGTGTSVFGALPPAGQDQQLLNELLTTHYFQTRVATLSPLGHYVATHPSPGWGPSALISRLRKKKTLADRVAAALSSKYVVSNARGPHVLEVSFDAPSPDLAVKTLRVILSEFAKERGVLRQDALVSSRKQVDSASAALSLARTNLTRYLGAHPSSTRSDPQLSALAVAERDAVTQLANATQALNQASLSVTSGAASQTVLRVVDQPQVPIGATTGKLRLVKSLVLGLFAGAIVSILGLVALVRIRRSSVQPTDADTDVVVTEAPFAERRPAGEQRLERAE